MSQNLATELFCIWKDRDSIVVSLDDSNYSFFVYFSFTLTLSFSTNALWFSRLEGTNARPIISINCFFIGITHTYPTIFFFPLSLFLSFRVKQAFIFRKDFFWLLIEDYFWAHWPFKLSEQFAWAPEDGVVMLASRCIKPNTDSSFSESNNILIFIIQHIGRQIVRKEFSAVSFLDHLVGVTDSSSNARSMSASITYFSAREVHLAFASLFFYRMWQRT